MRACVRACVCFSECMCMCVHGEGGGGGGGAIIHTERMRLYILKFRFDLFITFIHD